VEERIIDEINESENFLPVGVHFGGGFGVVPPPPPPRPLWPPPPLGACKTAEGEKKRSSVGWRGAGRKLN